MTAALLAPSPRTIRIDAESPDPARSPAGFARWLADHAGGAPLVAVEVEGVVAAKAVLRLLGLLRPHLADGAEIFCAEADFTSVYDALAETVAMSPEYRFAAITVAPRDGDRPGRAWARLSFDRRRTAVQDPAAVPANKNRRLAAEGFAAAEPAMPLGTARTIVERAQARWRAGDPAEARRRQEIMAREFPDGAATAGYWHAMAGTPFQSFFTWGHDHDFGCGATRAGAMNTRHLEITSEAISHGLMPFDLTGRRVLNVGCWTGGDFLVLSGLGAEVQAIEEHPVSAAAAARLAGLSGCPVRVEQRSLYADRPDWAGSFDMVYCSGVIYHVTDPLLLMRICFAYLKPGGRLVIETKAEAGEASACSYAGTREKGWNWYAPTWDALGRWFEDAGFPAEGVRLHWRPIGRLLGAAVKGPPCALPDAAGFSRPGSWLEGEV